MRVRQERETGLGSAREEMEVALWPRQPFSCHYFACVLIVFVFFNVIVSLVLCFYSSEIGPGNPSDLIILHVFF